MTNGSVYIPIKKPSIDELEEASVRKNTRLAYQSDIRHYRDIYCGLLPALPSHLVNYLHAYCDQLNPETLARRLEGISAWHVEHGFIDNTRNERVRKVLRGIRHHYGKPTKQAYPLIEKDIARIVEYLNSLLATPINSNKRLPIDKKMRVLRDKALILYMFWRGLRAHQAVMLDVKLINNQSSEKWNITYLPDKTHAKHYSLDLYSVSNKDGGHLCPIRAIEEFINTAQITEGPVFTKMFIGGDMAKDGMHPNSLNPWIKTLCEAAGVKAANNYSISSHSPRTGFATSFANELGYKRLMHYMGWKSEKVALRYIQVIDQDQAMRSITSHRDEKYSVNSH